MNAALIEAVDPEVRRAWAAAEHPRWRDPASRADALERVSLALKKESSAILDQASRETGLTRDELTPELARMVRALRLFADLVREGSWVRAAIDGPCKDPAAAIGPNHDLRRMLVPLGRVVGVFGASNFPLAYGVCGGDTASAWAAGCAVVVKEHPAHPKTGSLIVTIARGAFEEAGLPRDLLGYVRDDETAGFHVARALVSHELVCAIGFTGSRGSGLAIETIARERDVPIPVFAEMSSTNPVFITRGAIEARGPEIGRMIVSSVLARYGQQCTCPGLIFPEIGVDHEPLLGEIRRGIAAQPARRMLSTRVREGYAKQASTVGSFVPEVELLAMGGEGAGSDEAPALAYLTDWDSVRSVKFLSDEMFGPGMVIAPIDFAHPSAIEDVLATIGNHLTASLFHVEQDLDRAHIRGLCERLAGIAGRVIFNGVPTGVRVAGAMVHGGPFPATNRPESTAAGPLAIERWCRPVCWQNCPDVLLPPELRDGNPRGIVRVLNGVREAAGGA
ncbi:MAG: aldehyde dehydrogenase family protein [Phycisphaerales bacterium]|nr:aldehyde dehydrogenase family protein [Phycisphaerales bacterium]